MSEDNIIEGLKDLIIDRESFINSNDKDSIFVKDKQVLEQAINLIKKQQLELEKARNTKSLYYENKELRKELKKKDKIIDAMSEQLVGLAMYDNEKDDVIALMTEKQVKQYFERKVENEC